MPLDKGVHLKCAHTEGRGAISYAPDGRHIVTCGEDTFVKIFEAEELSAEPRTLEIHDAPVTALAMDRKGARVVTGTDAHIASVFSYPSGEGMRMLTRMQSAVRCIALDPKGRIAAVGAEDGAIRMCMVNASGAGASQFVSVKGHTDAVLCIAFDPKGEYLASSSADGNVRIWDIRDDPTTVKTLSVCGRVLPASAQQLGVCWHPQGETLAVPKGAGAILLDRGTWEETATFESGGAGKDGHSRDVSTTAFSPNGRYLATAGLDKQIFVWDAACGESLDRHRGDATPCGLCWSPTANTLCFLDDSGQLGIWSQPVPAHYPPPVGDGETATAANAAAGAAPTPGAKPAAAPAAAGTAAAEGSDGAAPEGSTPAARGEEGGDESKGGRRRLRKVVHDSDDGGFSDHDDDEAVEAAMLAAQLKLHGTHGASAAADAATGGGAGSAGLSAAKAAAALLAAAPAAPVQEVLQPSATPLRNSRRFLLWNLTGMVLSRDENTYSAIEVEFNDATKHRTMRLTDHYGFSMAALDEAAVLFASRSNHGNPSTVVYRPLASWAPNSDWQVQLEKGEEAVAVAVGHKFALVATSARYLRVYSHTGAPRSLLCHGGPLVALAASRGLAALVTHAGRGALSDDQALLVTLYDLREPARPVRLASELLPLSPGATLDWVGFSEAGALSTVDSAGVVRQCVRSAGLTWMPILHCASAKKSKAEHHWVVGLTGGQLMCILCKGDDKYPATLPRPVLTALPLAMPLACSEPAEAQLEAQRIAAMVELDEYRLAASEVGLGEDETAEHTMRLVTKIDSLALKLFQTANKTERNARALDLALSLQLPKSLHGALKLANHFKLGPLADRLSRLLEARHDDADPDEDLESAPPRAPPAARAPAAPATQEAAADADDERESGANENDAPPRQKAVAAAAPAGSGAAPTLLNPFARAADEATGKSVLELGGTGKAPKRKAGAAGAGGAKRAR